MRLKRGEHVNPVNGHRIRTHEDMNSTTTRQHDQHMTTFFLHDNRPRGCGGKELIVSATALAKHLLSNAMFRFYWSKQYQVDDWIVRALAMQPYGDAQLPILATMSAEQRASLFDALNEQAPFRNEPPAQGGA